MALWHTIPRHEDQMPCRTAREPKSETIEPGVYMATNY